MVSQNSEVDRTTWKAAIREVPREAHAQTSSQNGTQMRYSLSTDGEVVMGRDSGCQIVIDSNQYPGVSRHHAKVRPLPTKHQPAWHICDLKAANGTYINGNRLAAEASQLLRPGDRIALGKDGPEFIFEFQAANVAASVSVASVPDKNPAPPVEPVSPPVKQATPAQIPQPPSSKTSPPVVAPPAAAPVPAATRRSLWHLSTEQDMRTLAGHADAIRSVAFSSNRQILASGSADKTIKLWNLNTLEEISTLSGHKLAVNAVAFSLDGTILASGSADKTIKLWNLITGEEIRTFSGHKLPVNAVAFNPNGEILASGSLDKTIKLWNLKTEEEISTLSGHRLAVNAVAFSLDGQGGETTQGGATPPLLASGSTDKTIKLWNYSTGEEIATLSGHRAAINSLTFSLDGQGGETPPLLASGSEDNTIKLWNLSTSEEIRTISGYSWQVGAVAISTDGCLLASGSQDGKIKIWQP